MGQKKMKKINNCTKTPGNALFQHIIRLLKVIRQSRQSHRQNPKTDQKSGTANVGVKTRVIHTL